MQINIRKAKPEEWQDIQKLNNDVFQNDKDNDKDLILDWPYLEIGVSYYKRLASGQYGWCLVAESDGAVVGYVALAKKSFDYRSGKYMEVENIGVSPEFRSHGIGQKLMEEAVKLAKEKGCNRLYVEAYWGNKKAIKYYKNNGFEEMGVSLEKRL